MRKIGTLEHVTKVVALCLPPIVMSLIGLAALSRKTGRAAVVAGRPPRLLGLPGNELAPDEAFAR